MRTFSHASRSLGMHSNEINTFRESLTVNTKMRSLVNANNSELVEGGNQVLRSELSVVLLSVCALCYKKFRICRKTRLLHGEREVRKDHTGHFTN